MCKEPRKVALVNEYCMDGPNRYLRNNHDAAGINLVRMDGSGVWVPYADTIWVHGHNMVGGNNRFGRPDYQVGPPYTPGYTGRMPRDYYFGLHASFVRWYAPPSEDMGGRQGTFQHGYAHRPIDQKALSNMGYSLFRQL
jgi:hypothetical protein